jgi:hypothetical protein
MNGIKTANQSNGNEKELDDDLHWIALWTFKALFHDFVRKNKKN